MAPTIDPRSRLEALYEAILFTYVRLKVDPRLQAYVPVFEQLLAEWWDTFKMERGILDEGIAADAAVTSADKAIDRTSDGVAGTVLIDVHNNRRSATFLRYFPKESPSRFKKPKLSEQLAAMRTWPPSLLASPNPTLNAYGAALLTQIEVADKSVEMVTTATQKIVDFRATGARKQLFDKVNGVRKKLHGDASKMVHDHPEWSLPKSYADDLFQHEPAEREPSIAELAQKIESTAAELAKLKARHEARIKEEEAEAHERIEAEKQTQQAELEAAAKAAAEANARLEQLKAKLATPGA